MEIPFKQPTLTQRVSTFFAMVKKELVTIARYPVDFVSSFLQVFVIVLIFTLAGLTFAPPDADTSGTAGVVIYGFIMFMYLSDTLWTIGFNVRFEQTQGTLEQLYLSPASKFASLIARVFHLLVWTSLLCVMAMVVMSILLGGLPTENLGLGLLYLGLNLMGTFGLGFAFAAITLRLKQTADTLANLFQFFFMIFGACFFPFSALPDAMLWVSKALPMAYGVDLFRSTLMGYPGGFPELAPLKVEIVIVALYGVLMPLIGYWLFQREEHRARMQGALGEY